jgi:hypothetical protein
MARSIELLVRIAVDAAAAGADIDRAASSADKFAAGMGELAIPAAAAGAAVVAFGKGALDAASASQQAIGAVNSVFGDSAAQVQAWAATSADAVGLSTSAYEAMASTVGAQLQNMGVDQKTAAGKTNDLITMGADLAATFGGSTADAVSALGAALRGEADPAERYGLSLSQTAVAARMAKDGTDKLTGTAKTAAKAQTVLQLATEQAAGANGQFARESDTAEGAAQRSAAAYENAQAAIGQGLLPVMTTLQTALAGVAQWMGQNSTAVLVAVAVIGALAAAVLIVNGALALASAATAAWTAVQLISTAVTTGATAAWTALSAVMAANPVMIVVIAVIALIAGIILLWRNCEAFRNFVTGMWKAIAGAATAAWSAISSAASAAWSAIRSVVGSVVGAITSAVSSAGAVIQGIWNTIRGAAQSAWSAIGSLVASVVGGIRSAVSGIVGGIVSAWNSVRSAAESCWNAIRSLVSTVTSGISSAVSGMLGGIQAVWSSIQSAGMAVWGPIASAAESAFGGIMSVIGSVQDAIDSVIGGIQSAASFVSDLWGKITGASSAAASIPVPKAAAPAGAVGFTAASSPSLGRSGLLAPRATTAAVAGPTIIVQGALDPDAVARQISALLTRRSRRAVGVQL